MNNAVTENQAEQKVTTLNGVELNPRKTADLGNEHSKKLHDHFVYHKPTPGQVPSYAAINEAARVLAQTIQWNTPPGADQTAAIRLVVQAKMTANSAIATNPGLYENQAEAVQ